MELQYSFVIDPAETVRATRLLRRRPLRWAHWAVWPILALLAAFYASLGVPLRELWVVGLVVGVLLALQLMGPLLQRRQVKRFYADAPKATRPHVYRFDEDGLTISSGGSATTLAWAALREARESSEFFLLHFARGSAYYLPKRALGSPLEEQRLREFIGAKARS